MLILCYTTIRICPMRKTVCILMSLLALGCVDKSIDLSKLEGNVGTNADNLAIPLGYLTDKSLGELLSDKVDNLVADPVTGDYSLTYSSDNQSVNIDGSSNFFTLPAASYSMEVDYPSFKLDNSEYLLDDVCYIRGMLDGVELLLGQEIYCPVAGLKLSGEESGKSDYSLEVQVPSYIEAINKIYPKYDASLPGAPVEALFDLGSLADISTGGKISLAITLPEGFEVYDEQFNLVSNGVYRVENRPIADGESTVAFKLYVRSISNSKRPENGVLNIAGNIQYSLSYELQSKEGKVIAEELPIMTLKSHFICDDAEVTLASMELIDSTFKSSIVAKTLNDNVKSVKSIEFANTTLRLNLQDGLQWDNDAVMAGALEDILIDITLPDYLKVEVYDDGVEFDNLTNTLHTTLARFRGGLSVHLKRLDFGAEGVSPDADGNVVVDLNIDVRANLKQGANIHLKHLQQDGVTLTVGYEELTMIVASVTGCVDFKHEQSASVDLASLFDKGNFQINGLGVSPVVDFSISNSFTLPLYVSATIVPVRDGVAAVQDAVTVEPFEIKPATLGEHFADIVPTVTAVRLGTDLEPTEGVTTINCDLEKLLGGAMPESLDINLAVATDPTKDVTLAIVANYPIEYCYSFDMPLAFGEAFDLSFDGSASGISETISGLDLDLSASGSVALACEVENSTPLNLALELQMLNASGTPTLLQAEPIGEAVIRGSTDGVQPCKSTIRFRLDSGSDNLLDGLKEVEDIRYTLRATSAAAGVALNRSQTISAAVVLEVDGNISVNIDFTGGEEL